MKKFFILICSVLAVSCASDQQPKRVLFNGNNLEGWSFALEKGAEVEAAMKVFAAEDGVIKVSGVPFGYLYTDEQYAEYKLHFEWRWVGEPNNSGVFIHVQNPGDVWPRAYEYQLMAGHAGDMVMLGGSEIEDFECVGEFPIKPRKQDAEKSAGEWNVGEIVVDGTIVKFYVNGVLQNEAVTKFDCGHIALQSEGGALEFREIYMQDIK